MIVNRKRTFPLHLPAAVAIGLGSSGMLFAQAPGYYAPELPSNHALLITVSGYKGHVLPGVEKDRKTAIDLSHRLGVPVQNIVELSESQVTREGVRQALADMNQTILPGDRLFVYFSGHGARTFNKETGQCVESIVMQPINFLTNREFASMMKPLSAKADKTIVMLDSCFSGGVAQTAAARTLMQQRPKSLPSSPECSRGVNERGFSQQRGTDFGTTDNNLVVLAAARNNEVAWDTSYGGALTYNAEQCFARGAKDAHQSGSLSMDDLAACVQARLDKSQTEDVRQHATLAGNGGLIAGFVASPAAATEADPAAMLNDIYRQRDDRWQVDVNVDQPTLKIGTNLTMSIRSQRSGYAYVFFLGSQPNSFYLLFPNELDSRNQIGADAALRLPGPDWSVTALGPKGTDHLLVMVTQTPRDFSKLALPAEYVSQAGPFEKIQPSTRSAALITRIATLSAAAPDSPCGKVSSKRDLGVAQQCSSAFGANQMSVEETEPP